MKELLKIIKKKPIIISFVLATIYYICEYGCSFALAYFGTTPFTLEKVINLTICLAILYLIMLISNWLTTYIDNSTYPLIEIQVQRYYLEKVQNMSTNKINQTHTGYIYNLIKDASTCFANLLWFIGDTILALIIATISFLYMACKQSVFMGIVCIVICFFAVYTKYILRIRRKKYDKELRNRHSKYVATFIDFIQNITTVRKLNISKFCNNEIDKKVDTYKKAIRINEVKRANQNMAFTGLMNSIYIVLLISTIGMVKNGQDALPYLLFYMTLMGKVWGKLNNLTRLLDNNVELKTVKQQLDNLFKENIQQEVISNWNKVELKEVIFNYNDKSTKIKIPEFILNKGDKISIMGESGQGKSTTMNILAGLYPLEKGTFKVDGKNISKGKLDLVFVSQEVEFFDLSIRDNLCLGKQISDFELEELLKDSGLYEWYKNLPNGLDTQVGERGIKLSAGQKQRLNIIRGILIDKELYVFDEPTSNLDIISEEKIIDMIERYLKDKTYVIVTHRERIKRLCNRHYMFENNMMREMVKIESV